MLRGVYIGGIWEEEPHKVKEEEVWMEAGGGVVGILRDGRLGIKWETERKRA